MAGINSSIQREYARLRDQEKSLGELTASELEQTVVWDKHFMDEHVFNVQGLPVVVAGDLLADALAQLPEGKRDVILLSYFLGMTDREISDKLNIVHQTVSKRRLAELERNTGKQYDKLYIVGGGAKNEFLNHLTARATGKRVVALPIEATALGNLKIQMEADQ